VKIHSTEKKSLRKNEVLLVNVKNKFEDCSSNCTFLKFIDRVSHMCRLVLSGLLKPYVWQTSQVTLVSAKKL
jgi:hypothetical protein